jgi:hypothetical protein
LALVVGGVAMADNTSANTSTNTSTNMSADPWSSNSSSNSSNNPSDHEGLFDYRRDERVDVRGDGWAQWGRREIRERYENPRGVWRGEVREGWVGSDDEDRDDD